MAKPNDTGPRPVTTTAVSSRRAFMSAVALASVGIAATANALSVGTSELDRLIAHADALTDALEYFPVDDTPEYRHAWEEARQALHAARDYPAANLREVLRKIDFLGGPDLCGEDSVDAIIADLTRLAGRA